MTSATFKLEGERIHLACEQLGHQKPRDLKEDAGKLFESWITTYKQAHGCPDQEQSLLRLGREMYRWLDGMERWLEQLLDLTSHGLTLEFQVAPRAKHLAPLFLECPWEILAEPNDGDFLAADSEIGFSPVRRIGQRTKDFPQASEYQLSMVFMAAAPGQLSYEDEESAILRATADSGLDLIVEESGTLGQVAQLLRPSRKVNVLHLSCHGTFYNKNPVLLLETDEGDKDQVDIDRFADEVGAENLPPLAFLSACKSGEPTEALVRSLSSDFIRRGFAAVLGWGNSVSDADATIFAEIFYAHLAKEKTTVVAASLARRHLLNLLRTEKKDIIRTTSGRDWHLARLYLGPKGGGQLTCGKKARRLNTVDAGIKEFLGQDRRIPVAGRFEFVGRRKQVQKILKEFRLKKHAGVLIHAVGNQGKSSLAARVANRLSDLQTTVVYEHYGANDILFAIEKYNNRHEVKAIIERHRQAVDETPSLLSTALIELLEGPFQQLDQKEGKRPILLVIDDFEQALGEDATGLHRVRGKFAPAITAVIEAFDQAQTHSRLLFTSRFQFEIIGAERLLEIPLSPMDPHERLKQATAKAKELGLHTRPPLTDRCLEVAQGNPGIQDLLFGLCAAAKDLKDHAAVAAATKALDEMEDYIKSGEAPSQEKLLERLTYLALDKIQKLLTDNEIELLRAASLFSVPAPRSILEELSSVAGYGKKGEACKRLIAFGALDVYADPTHPEEQHLLPNTLVLARFPELEKQNADHLARLVVGPLQQFWGGDKLDRRTPLHDYELARLALLAGDNDVLIATAKNAVAFAQNNLHYETAAEFAQQAIAALEQHQVKPDLWLYAMAAEVCHSGSAIKKEGEILAKALALATSDKAETPDEKCLLAKLAIIDGRRLVHTGEPDIALKRFNLAQEHLQDPQFKREHAVTLGDIARIYVDKGEVDQALKLHQEELEVYEQLGDKRSHAVTLGDIARIYVAKGEVDQALKLHQERLEVFKQLGDLDGIANTLWSMAQIDLHHKQHQQAYEKLSQSYDINLKLDRLDGICWVGLDLGRLLCGGGHRDEGLEILIRSKEGFNKLGWVELAEQVGNLIDSYTSPETDQPQRS